ncbi:hypothetical protein [Rhizobium sp. C4]|uniref:hypothetical protein n=1 Tax=Rhizobium sp. C4 TaxID=1349800 RepID=UPI001E585326|nr:hypothetical protein [Rhizobium sp. C4]MCD2171842.1 hypothetical protein [Rhizobium sp. C4]
MSKAYINIKKFGILLPSFLSKKAFFNFYCIFISAVSLTFLIYTPFLYSDFARVRNWCYVPYVGTSADFLREVSVHALLMVVPAVFLSVTILGLLRSRNIIANISIFIYGYFLVVVVFAMYFYTFGITATKEGQASLGVASGEIAKNIYEYLYFSLANSIFMTTPEFAPCPSLRAAVILQRVSSLVVAFGAGLVGSRITKLIE